MQQLNHVPIRSETLQWRRMYEIQERVWLQAHALHIRSYINTGHYILPGSRCWNPFPGGIPGWHHAEHVRQQPTPGCCVHGKCWAARLKWCPFSWYSVILMFWYSCDTLWSILTRSQDWNHLSKQDMIFVSSLKCITAYPSGAGRSRCRSWGSRPQCPGQSRPRRRCQMAGSHRCLPDSYCRRHPPCCTMNLTIVSTRINRCRIRCQNS
jgi:hypothetical protein